MSTITPKETPQYRWPSLKPVIRQYVVRDDLGRYGIAYSDNCYHEGILFAHPMDVSERIDAGNAILMTDTVWDLKDDGTYTGFWYDYDGPTFPSTVPPELTRRITIISDLGYLLPDSMAAEWLTGSDEMGHWDSYYAQRSGRKGGSATSAAKAKSSAVNGRLGGRPRKTVSDDDDTERHGSDGEHTLKYY